MACKYSNSSEASTEGLRESPRATRCNASATRPERQCQEEMLKVTKGRKKEDCNDYVKDKREGVYSNKHEVNMLQCVI